MWPRVEPLLTTFCGCATVGYSEGEYKCVEAADGAITSCKVAIASTYTYEVYGCTDPTADNYNSAATQGVASMCQRRGCNDTDARNYLGTVSATTTGAQHARGAKHPCSRHER